LRAFSTSIVVRRTRFRLAGNPQQNQESEICHLQGMAMEAIAFQFYPKTV
jgi:hypothetical protein